jgi:hypothetical protein
MYKMKENIEKEKGKEIKQKGKKKKEERKKNFVQKKAMSKADKLIIIESGQTYDISSSSSRMNERLCTSG